MITFFDSRNGLTKVSSPTHMDFESGLKQIKNGKWIANIQKIRATYQLGDKLTTDNLKNRLPVFMFGGRFNGQKIADLDKPSNLVILDLDNFESINILQKNKILIENDIYTRACFVSVKGFGLKVIVAVDADTDNNSHHEYFNALKNYYESKYPNVIPYWDDSSKNINRLCYISHDPDLYYNPNSSVWTKRTNNMKKIVCTEVNSTTIVQPYSSKGYTDKEAERIIRFLEGSWESSAPMVNGHRHNSTFFRAKELCEYGVSKDTAFVYFEQFKKDSNDPDDIDRQINNAYQRTLFNIKKLP